MRTKSDSGKKGGAVLACPRRRAWSLYRRGPVVLHDEREVQLDGGDTSAKGRCLRSSECRPGRGGHTLTRVVLLARAVTSCAWTGWATRVQLVPPKANLVGGIDRKHKLSRSRWGGAHVALVTNRADKAGPRGVSPPCPGSEPCPNGHRNVVPGECRASRLTMDNFCNRTRLVGACHNQASPRQAPEALSRFPFSTRCVVVIVRTA